METFVLVIFMTYGYGSGVTLVEYDTSAQCRAAERIVDKELYIVSAYCIPGRR